MKRIVLLIAIIGSVTITQAQTPDWSSKVAAVVYDHCSSCHHAGGIAPFPLMSYEDAVVRSADIQSSVNAGKMPPWPPSQDCGQEVIGDRRLSADDIATINDWVNGGMPEGDPSTAPGCQQKTHVDMVAEPKRKRYMPAVPKISNIARQKRPIEIFGRMDSEKVTEGNGKGAITGKIEEEIKFLHLDAEHSGCKKMPPLVYYY